MRKIKLSLNNIASRAKDSELEDICLMLICPPDGVKADTQHTYHYVCYTYAFDGELTVQQMNGYFLT